MKKKIKKLIYIVCDKLHLNGDVTIDTVLKNCPNGTIGISYFLVKARIYKFTKYKEIAKFQRSIDAINFLNKTLGLDKDLQVKRIGKKREQ